MCFFCHQCLLLNQHLWRLLNPSYLIFAIKDHVRHNSLSIEHFLCNILVNICWLVKKLTQFINYICLGGTPSNFEKCSLCRNWCWWGLGAVKTFLFRNTCTYLFWHKWRWSLKHRTSMPRKKFKAPKSFRANSWFRWSINS